MELLILALGGAGIVAAMSGMPLLGGMLLAWAMLHYFAWLMR